MTRRLVVSALLGLMVVLAWAAIAQAAVSDVRVGNFYFEDGSVGDGQIVITAGDQLRFIVEDSGPGTPHTIDIDAFGVHSGNMAKGETFTTPALTEPGTYALYCSLHRNRGHETTLVILAAPGTTTTTASPTTTTTTTTTGATTTTTGQATTTTALATTTTSEPATTEPTSTEDPTAGETDTSDSTTPEPETATGEDPAAPVDDADAKIVSDTDIETASEQPGEALAPVGRGEIALEELEALPPDPDSLAAILGRPPASDAPWTRAVRQALLALIPLTLIVAAALLRHQRAQADTPS
jgi:plastocyanin